MYSKLQHIHIMLYNDTNSLRHLAWYEGYSSLKNNILFYNKQFSYLGLTKVSESDYQLHHICQFYA
jgi:hypothetical protein